MYTARDRIKDRTQCIPHKSLKHQENIQIRSPGMTTCAGTYENVSEVLAMYVESLYSFVHAIGHCPTRNPQKGRKRRGNRDQPSRGMRINQGMPAYSKFWCGELAQNNLSPSREIKTGGWTKPRTLCCSSNCGNNDGDMRGVGEQIRNKCGEDIHSSAVGRVGTGFMILS